MKRQNNHSNPTAVNTQGATDIHLKASTKGSLHRDMHVKQGKELAASSLQREKAIAKKDGNVTLEKKVVFAINARKWNH